MGPPRPPPNGGPNRPGPPKNGVPPRIPDRPGIGFGGLSDLLYQENGVPLAIFERVFSKKYIKPSRLGGFWGSFFRPRPSKSGQVLRARADQTPVLGPRTGFYSRCNMVNWTPPNGAPGRGGSKNPVLGGSGPPFWGVQDGSKPPYYRPPRRGGRNHPPNPFWGGPEPLFWGSGGRF